MPCSLRVPPSPLSPLSPPPPLCQAGLNDGEEDDDGGGGTRRLQGTNPAPSFLLRRRRAARATVTAAHAATSGAPINGAWRRICPLAAGLSLPFPGETE